MISYLLVDLPPPPVLLGLLLLHLQPPPLQLLAPTLLRRRLLQTLALGVLWRRHRRRRRYQWGRECSQKLTIVSFDYNFNLVSHIDHRPAALASHDTDDREG